MPQLMRYVCCYMLDAGRYEAHHGVRIHVGHKRCSVKMQT
jgi:hypothetical protein